MCVWQFFVLLTELFIYFFLAPGVIPREDCTIVRLKCMWRQRLSGRVLEQAVHDRLSGNSHSLGSFREKPEMLESAGSRTCVLMSLIPLRNVLKQ